MKPKVKKFTKDEPCTKAHLHNCFADADGNYQPVQVNIAKSIIGANAPRHMADKGYVVIETVDNETVYKLTDSGQQWLLDGVRQWRKLHPDSPLLEKPIPGEAAKPVKQQRRRLS